MDTVEKAVTEMNCNPDVTQQLAYRGQSKQEETDMTNKVAVIAGTKVDTQMGMDYLKAKDPSLEPDYYNVSPRPEDQHIFQYGDMETKKRRMTEIFEDAESKGIRDFFIYCNSLSGAFDFEPFAKERGVRVVTPLMVYRELAKRYSKVAVIAANNLSSFNIDKTMIEAHPGMDVIGMGMLDLVLAIEAQMPPAEMMEHFHMKDLAAFFEGNEVECWILGCTHFPYFKEELAKITSLLLIDPADEMYEILIRGMRG